MNKDIAEVLYSEHDIQDACKNLGREITKMYMGEKLLVIGILKGSFIFMSDLIKNIDMQCKVDFMEASSYYGKSTESSGIVTITKELDLPVEGYHVIVVEDIVDSGNTLYYVKRYLESQGALSIRICAMFDKPCRRTAEVETDLKGFTIGDQFIVGYGLDFDEKYRNLPYVGLLRPELYEDTSD